MWLADRFLMSDATVAAGRETLAAAQEAGSLPILGLARLSLGMALLLRLELDEAERELMTAVRISERIGDDATACRSLNYLALLHRCRGDPMGVRSFLDELEPRVTRAGMQEYMPQALANRAWLALHDGDLERARALGRAALGHPAALGPLEFIARWPLLAVDLSAGDIDDALGQARSLLAPPQYLLMEPVRARLEEAVELAESGDMSAMELRLRSALAEAESVGYA